MSSKTLFERAVEALVVLPNRLYGGLVKRTSKAVGLEPQLRRAHSLVVTSMLDDTIELEVGSSTAVFGVSSPTEYRRLRGRLFETNKPILEELLGVIEPDDVVWDVGAHVGRYSCFLGQSLDDGCLVAIEAHPKNVESLQANLERNEVTATVLPYALADTSGETEFSISLDEVGEFIRGAEYHEGTTDDARRHVTVETITGDSLVEERDIPSPTVVRMDITGGETAAIDGMDGVLSDPACRLVYVECYEDRYDSPDAVESRLRAHGFDTEHLDGRILKAVRDTKDAT